MKVDEYLSDAKTFLNLAGEKITDGMTRESCIECTLLLAVGMEKLLKYILARINPIFILSSPDFKHSAAIYRDHFLADVGGAVEKKPDSNVLTFRSSLTRAKVFSAAAVEHSQLLSSLAGWRDVIAHRPTTELQTSDLERMLKKDAYLLVEAFSSELGLQPGDFLGKNTDRLAETSQMLTNRLQFEQRMDALLREHAELWAHRKKTNPAIMEQASAITRNLMSQGGESYMYDEVRCPACGNTAAVRIAPDYDYADGEGYLAGVYADELKCFFCSLRIDDYAGLEFVGIDELLSENP